MIRYAGGSEWRKWDLHVHAPGTRLSSQYGQPSEDTWARFCSIIESSDVAVIGITDYFTCDSFFEFRKEHRARYPRSDKVFLPNLELRLNEAVNHDRQFVHVHVLFQPDITETKINEFLSALQTKSTDENGRKLTCADLTTEADFESATVTTDSVEEAIEKAFGRSTRSDHVLIFVPAGNDGIRPKSGMQRSKKLAHELDKFTDALFGGSKASEYYLGYNRYQNNEIPSRPKPVFSGCDAHGFPRLESALGRSCGNSA